MKRSIARRFLMWMLVLDLIGAGAVQSAHAGLVSTETAIASQQHAALVTRVQTKLARDDLQARFLQLGVAPADVDQRLAGLTDSELDALDRQINALPAGGNALAVVGIVFLVLLLLEVVGVLDIFKKP